MFASLRCLAALCLLLSPCLGADELPVDGPLELAQKVHDIFEAKCLDCHGADLPRPKGKFGYVLDLKRVADNPDYIIRGKPEDSELYKMVFNDEMPGSDANVPNLTPAEKDLVKRWIEAGAPGDLPGAHERENAATAAAIPEESGKAPEPLGKKFLRWLGNFHPLSTHFPVALMFVAVFAETLAWYTKGPTWLPTVRFLVVLAALGALAATPLGWLNSYFSSYNKTPGSLLWWHKWLGTGTAVWSLVCAALIVFGDCTEGSLQRRRFRGALIAGAALIGVSGFLGSALIYGIDHYIWR